MNRRPPHPPALPTQPAWSWQTKPKHPTAKGQRVRIIVDDDGWAAKGAEGVVRSFEAADPTDPTDADTVDVQFDTGNFQRSFNGQKNPSWYIAAKSCEVIG